MKYIAIIDDPNSQPEIEGVNLDGSRLVVDWNSLLLLLSKCQRQGCPESVLPASMKVSRQGNILKKEKSIKERQFDLYYRYGREG